MKTRNRATFILCASLLCNVAAAPALVRASGGAQAQGLGAGELYTARVKKSEASFSPTKTEVRSRRGSALC